jgi:hypothetical protein
MKLFKILELYQFCCSLKEEKLPFKVAYKLTKLSKICEHSVSFYQTEFNKIVSEYAERDENNNFISTDNGQTIKIKAGLEEECEKKISELSQVDVDDFVDIKFTLDELENLSLTISDLSCLFPFIIE